MDQEGQATDAQESAHSEIENRDESGVAELTAWATKEMLSQRFTANIPDIVERGGLATVTDEYLKGIGVQLLFARTKILDACNRKVMGCPKKTRFGGTKWYEPVLEKRPSGDNVWMNIGRRQTARDQETCRAALRTWRFCATGFDGLEDAALVHEAFDAWKPQAADEDESFFGKIFSDLMESVSTFFSSMPCCSR